MPRLQRDSVSKIRAVPAMASAKVFGRIRTRRNVQFLFVKNTAASGSAEKAVQ
jgi:hypothetical protein